MVASGVRERGSSWSRGFFFLRSLVTSEIVSSCRDKGLMFDVQYLKFNVKGKTASVYLNKYKFPMYISQIRRNDGRSLLEKED